VLLAAAPAKAALIQCDHHTMIKRDYDAMKSVATRAAGRHVLKLHEATPCINPGWGRMWIDAVEEPQSDGSVYLPHVLCNRETGPWKCEAWVNRILKFSVPIGGRDQQFALEIPPQFEVAEVGPLIQRAFQKEPSLTIHEHCGADPNAAPTKYDELEIENLRQAFAATGEPIEGSIEQDDQATTVEIDPIRLEFSRTPDKAAEKSFRCWSSFIIVT
jgi:hypothetical protein